jgi:hypothetical protein
MMPLRSSKEDYTLAVCDHVVYRTGAYIISARQNKKEQVPY